VFVKKIDNPRSLSRYFLGYFYSYFLKSLTIPVTCKFILRYGFTTGILVAHYRMNPFQIAPIITKKGCTRFQLPGS
jgi:hypothetical protein